jgi:hypothetical protein
MLLLGLRAAIIAAGVIGLLIWSSHNPSGLGSSRGLLISAGTVAIIVGLMQRR